MNPTHPLINTGPTTNGLPLLSAPVTKPKTIIKVPYHGERVSYMVYHPVLNWNLLTAYDEAKKEFMFKLNEWFSVVELYEDEMVRSENVTPKSLKRDIISVVREIDAERSCYKLEALAEALWDKVDHDDEDYDNRGRKVEQHHLPMMAELEKRADELKTMDLGLKMARPTAQHELIRRSWSG